MTQRWRWLTFLHWRYDVRVIQPLLPEGLECETFDGSAWVGLVPFQLEGVQFGRALIVPWISSFPETNVRTYVRGPDGKSGVWFFTLEADRLIAVVGARLLYHLPYRWATMAIKKSGNLVEYRSRRLQPFGQGVTDVAIEVGAPAETGDFDHFLTARFRLYTASGRRIATAQIEHDPWPLRTGRIVRLKQDLVEMSGVPRESGTPVLHYSEDLHVKVDRLRWL